MTDRDWADAHLINAALNVHRDDPAFGHRFIAHELNDHGLAAGENRAQRLCSSQRIWSVFAKKRGLTRKAGPPVHDDLVKRDFTATAPNRLWLTDITEHRTDEGKMNLCEVKDVHSNRIERLLDRLTHEGVPGRGRAAQRHVAQVSCGNCGAFGPRISISLEQLRPEIEEQWADRLDGQGGACADEAA